MRVNIAAARELIPLLEKLSYVAEEDTLRLAESEFAVVVGDVTFRQTNTTQHHTHYYARSIDACVGVLHRHAPWLNPRIDYAERTVRLVNGIGLPVGGSDHCSTADTMPLAFMVAILRAFADAAERCPAYSHDYVEPEEQGA